jgi:sensor histidine kinase YesM
VVLGAVSIFQEGIDILTQKEFSASENNISFEFDGIWYSDPQKINYFFMLESYSNKWEKTKDHTITFPKLPPGTYTFRVKASLNSNYYNSPETKYTFTIRPPFWQTWWFRSLSAGLIALIILIIIRRREERIRKFDRLQTEKIEFQFETLRSQVNPHFLFNSFNTLISIIESTPALAVEYVERLSGFFRSIITYRDQNLINLEEELKLLDNYIFIQRKRYGDNLTLEIRLDPPTRRNSFVPPLTLQLLAENGIKHNAVSRETPLRITITENHGRLEISNNINPKRSRESSTGMGLQNIMNRYELLTPEKVEIIREENKFTVVIPLLTSKNENFNR